MEKDRIIERIPFWIHLSETEKKQLKQTSYLHTYEKNEGIFDMDDGCPGMIYVQSGSIRVYITSEDGREVTLFHIGECECCILSSSCVMGEISLDVQLIANAYTEVLVVHAQAWQQIMERNIYVRCFAYELSTKRLSNVVFALQQILFTHFDVRLARFLVSLYEKTGNRQIKMTQEALAQEVNSAREVVARTLRQFDLEGYIEMKRGTILIKNIEALKKIGS